MEQTDAEFWASMAEAIERDTKLVQRMARGYLVRCYDVSVDEVFYRYGGVRFGCRNEDDEGSRLLASLGLKSADTPEIPLAMAVAYLKGPDGPRARRRLAVEPVPLPTVGKTFVIPKPHQYVQGIGQVAKE